MKFDVTIIVPTTCEAHRASLLRRAIGSVLSQEGVYVELIVVVNGDRVDPALYSVLSADERFRVLYLIEGNVSFARSAGLRVANGEFYGFLDDDDEFLPGALLTRTTEMRRDASIDVVVTNGYQCTDGSDTLFIGESFARKIAQDPLTAFMEMNWFHSPAQLFRSSAVTAATLNFRYRYLEWTYLFFLLMVNKRVIRYLDMPTYRYNITPGSVSKSLGYLTACPLVLKDIMALPLPPHIQKSLKGKHQSALHSLAVFHFERKNWRRALAYHLKCLSSGGWRFAPYTRKFISFGLKLRRR